MQFFKQLDATMNQLESAHKERGILKFQSNTTGEIPKNFADNSKGIKSPTPSELGETGGKFTEYEDSMMNHMMGHYDKNISKPNRPLASKLMAVKFFM